MELESNAKRNSNTLISISVYRWEKASNKIASARFKVVTSALTLFEIGVRCKRYAATFVVATNIRMHLMRCNGEHGSECECTHTNKFPIATLPTKTTNDSHTNRSRNDYAVRRCNGGAWKRGFFRVCVWETIG